jgi:hypothetical protein
MGVNAAERGGAIASAPRPASDEERHGEHHHCLTDDTTYTSVSSMEDMM